MWKDVFDHVRQISVGSLYGRYSLSQCCAGSELWKDFIARTCGRLIRDLGIDGIYLDSMGSTSAWACYNPAHHHQKRGGAWVREVGEYFRKVRTAV